MNWAWQLMNATPEVEQWVASPVVLKGRYHNESSFRFFYSPAQKWTGFWPENEWQQAGAQRLIRSLENRTQIYQRWLYHQVKNNPPDIIHAHFGPVGWRALRLSQQLQKPLVVSFYGYDYQSVTAQSYIWKERYQRLFETAVAVITTGPQGSQLLIEQGCPPEKIIALPLSIAGEKFPLMQRKKQAGSLCLVQVCTITEKKGHLDTLAALRLALTDCPNIHLTLAGEIQKPQLAAEMRRYIDEHGLAPHLTWLDFLPHENLPSLLAQNDVFIHPSHRSAANDVEGLPVTILEAAATGLPVISTYHADIPLAIQHEQSGLLAPERDVQALAAFIRRFYEMENDEYQAFSMAAHQRMHTFFEVGKTGEALAKLYNAW
ncbi:MAG: glycosyltransferase family 4 protein [Saprospiraceae bacterium]|nr:glycosyltransferase family 4 protein [Saprospiraceae bacterium]